jgi:RNA polymerase sigma factor (sigma-70 family)
MKPDDRAQFADWYGASAARVLAAVTLAVGDAGLAEEATAEAYVRAYAHWGKLRTSGNRPEAWVYTVAMNEIRTRFRRLRLERRYLDRQQPGAHPPPAEPQPALWAAVAQLSPRARTAVALRYVADLTEVEVAAAMGITRGAVASILHKARARLTELLVANGTIERTTP